MKTKIVRLTEKEAYIVWNLVCWFGKPFTHVLKSKLHRAVTDRGSFDKKYYDKKLMRDIIELGKDISKHPEWVK